MSDLCKHDLEPDTCSICKHGPSKPEHPVAYCRTCSAEIIWVRTENGKAMPIDVESGGPDAHFRFVARRGNRVHFVKGDEDNADLLYASHFVTCPDRDLHRRSR